MSAAALFIVAKRWEQPKGPSTDEWTHRIQAIHMLEYYLSLKRKEILTPATTWTESEEIIKGHEDTLVTKGQIWLDCTGIGYAE